MDESDRLSFEECPSCGGPATLGWLDRDLIEIECLDRCPPRVAQTPTLLADRDLDPTARVEVLADLFEQAILDTAATYGLADPRKAASLVADAWADVLREEGRPARSVEVATAVVRWVGERMHRRQP